VPPYTHGKFFGTKGEIITAGVRVQILLARIFRLVFSSGAGSGLVEEIKIPAVE
jgi:hypothetical protein